MTCPAEAFPQRERWRLPGASYFILVLTGTGMHKNLIAFNASQRTATDVAFRSGDVVRVYRRIVEGSKERVQMFEGMVIVVRGGQSTSPMLTVRKVSNGVGVEIIVPVHSPAIQKIEIVKHARVRRANIGFVRSKPAKKLRFKYEGVDTAARTAAVAQNDAADAVVADDLAKIEGIGPKIASIFADNGISSFAALADADLETLTRILNDNGLAGHDPATWSAQAVMARDARWDELSVWQDELKGGKETA